MTQTPFRVIEGNFNTMDKQKALEAALSQIERNFGKGSIMRLGKNEQPVEVEAISTGSLGGAFSEKLSIAAPPWTNR